ncbi:MAG TPA: hypothetical protein VFC68_07605 [Treponemataceae bacterium]|nr:hypothetical protein [Treponemataceae bacterium]
MFNQNTGQGFDPAEEPEQDYYGAIPEDAFFYEESAYKYGYQLGMQEAEDGIASETTLENFVYPVDADQQMIKLFCDAYKDAVKKYNSNMLDYDELNNEWN